MLAIVGEFVFNVNAQTRDECNAKLDDVSLAFLNHVGGAPWELVDDDVKRVALPNWAMSDDQGYAYLGIRKYIFRGPAMPGPGVPMHPNCKVQDGVGE